MNIQKYFAYLALFLIYVSLPTFPTNASTPFNTFATNEKDIYQQTSNVIPSSPPSTFIMDLGFQNEEVQSTFTMTSHKQNAHYEASIGGHSHVTNCKGQLIR